MRPIMLAMLLAGCTQPEPEPAPQADANSSAGYDALAVAAQPAFDAAKAANSIDPAAAAAFDPLLDSAPAAPADDECGAAKLQSLVGQPRSAIPSSIAAQARVACTTCPVTEDLRPDRLNIFYDSQTEVIERVNCG